MEERHLFTNTDIRKLLLPIMVEQLLASLMGMVDTIMVSNVGSAAISAVSLVDSINILVIQLFSCVPSIWAEKISVRLKLPLIRCC